MPRVTDPVLRAKLASLILNPRTDYLGTRPSVSEDGRPYGGQPRPVSRKHAVNRRRAYGAKSMLDSFYT